MAARPILPIAALVLVTAVWGLTFPVVKDAVERIPTFEFLALRFGLATLALLLIFPRAVRRLDRRTVRDGVLVGLALAAGYAFQTVGLTQTGATRAGLITGLYVVLTPLLAPLLDGVRVRSREAVGAVAAFLGLAVLAGSDALGFGLGDLLVLGCAFAFALHILLNDRYVERHAWQGLTVVQIATSAIVFAVVHPWVEAWRPPTDPAVWSALLLTAFGASAGAYLVQAWAQTRLRPTQVAVTFNLEPVFAAAAGFWLLGERLSLQGWIGAALMLGAMVFVSATGPPKTEPWPS